MALCSFCFADDARGWQCPFVLCLHPQGWEREASWLVCGPPHSTVACAAAVSMATWKACGLPCSSAAPRFWAWHSQALCPLRRGVPTECIVAAASPAGGPQETLFSLWGPPRPLGVGTVDCSSLCYTLGPCWLSISYIVEYIC